MEFDKNKYKVYTWKNWMFLHYILNPGIAIGELLFGQRIAKVGLVEKDTDKPFIERNFVPCPHCGTLHGYKTWSGKRGSQNWFGLYCPNCKQIIPCLTNITSFIILAITSPFWYPFKNRLKQIWLEKQARRFENIQEEELPLDIQKKYNWIISGLIFGIFMFVISIFVITPLTIEELLSSKGLFSLALWLSAGLAWGAFMKCYMTSKKIN